MKKIFGNKIDNLAFQAIFDEIDLDKDGKINFEDFKNLLLY
jgi:Ca2+-binding EF-hand superfamily protein